MATNSGNKYRKNFTKKNKSVMLYRKKKSKREVYVQQLERLKEAYDKVDTTTFENLKKFDQLPLTSETLKGLEKNKYMELTEIQRDSIVLALKGHDILGAAKTGSGKTLAFVIPVLECLFREGWSVPAGLGALVITPTRELAYQIYEVFQKVGSFHDFTVALVIGGKDLDIERKVLNQYNIVICTPGRLLQHMDENPLFDAINLQILVLDEADRILDLGFAATMNAIIENLPQERQTLLFSATQTKSVKDLARLSLKDPKYVSVHEHAKYSTPESLIQSYLVCEVHEKLNFLWSFLKRHKKQKTLVFMATCKQVKYTHDAFCRLRPGVSVTALYGSLHQLRRMERYRDFCNKQHIVMFATDIAARGLDFPNVNWVLQLDCPEDVNTYIHRAGRTARYQDGGESLLVLSPSEKESMVEQMVARRIPISEIKVNPRELTSITKKLELVCSYDPEMAQSAQRAFSAYLKNIFLMKEKTVFDVRKINLETYSRSLGLISTPRTRFLNKHLKTQPKPQQVFRTSAADSESKNPALCVLQKDYETTESENNDQNSLNAAMRSLKTENSDENEDTPDAESRNRLALFTLNSSEREETFNEFGASEAPNECMGNTLYISRTHEAEEEEIALNFSSKKPITKAAVAKKILKLKIKPNKKIVFNEEGEAVDSLIDSVKNVVTETTNESLDSYKLEITQCTFAEVLVTDRELEKEKLRRKRRDEKIKIKKAKQQERGEEDGEVCEDNSEKVRSRREDMKQFIDELPDPDAYFGKEHGNSDDDEDNDRLLSTKNSNDDDVMLDVEQSDDDDTWEVEQSDDADTQEAGNDDSIVEYVSEILSESMESISKNEQPKERQKRKAKKLKEWSHKKMKLSEGHPSAVKFLNALDTDEDLALNLLQSS